MPGVPTLRSALRRARKAGAVVEHVHSTGQIRVSTPDARIVLSARRKDATRDLVQLVDQIESHPIPRPHAIVARPEGRPAMPEPVPAPDPGNVRPGRDQSFASRLRVFLRAQPADPEGWRPYDSPTIARQLGVTTTQVAYTIASWQKAGHVDVQKAVSDPAVKKSRLVAIRFTDRPARQYRTAGADRMASPVFVEPAPAPFHRARPKESVEPAPRPVASSRKVAPDVPDTPTLAAYAEAKRIARGQPMLSVDPSRDQLDAILSEALRLFWWLRR